jgi:hypothetical protein
MILRGMTACFTVSEPLEGVTATEATLFTGG